MSTDNKTFSTAERAEIDPVFKEVLTINFRQFSLPIQTQVEVSRLPRTMDALAVLSQPEEREKVRSSTAFSYFRVHNQIEFKGFADPLTRAGYRLILGRTNLYLGENDLSASDMTVTIISARQPRKVLYQCPLDVRWVPIGVGHYKSTSLLPVHLFVSNELPLEPKNYPLLLFAASKEKFRQFLERIVGEDNTVYIYYAQRIDYKLTEEVLEMAGKSSSYRKNLEHIAEDIGKDLIPFFSAEDLARGLSSKEQLRGLNDEEQKRLQQLLQKLMEEKSATPPLRGEVSAAK